MGLWTILVVVCLPFAVFSHSHTSSVRDKQSANSGPLIQVDHQRCLSITRQTRYEMMPMPYLCRPGKSGGIPVPTEMNDDVALALLNLHGEGFRLCQRDQRVPIHRYIPVPVCCPGWAKDPVGGCTISTFLMKKGFCLNGGIPVMKNGPPTCLCSPGFGGPICQFTKPGASQSMQKPRNTRPMSFTKRPMQFKNGQNTKTSFRPPHQMPRGMNGPMSMKQQMPRGMNGPMQTKPQMPRGMNRPMPMRPQMPRGMNRPMPMRPQMPRGMNRPTPMGPQMPRGMNRPMSTRQQMPRGMNRPMTMRPQMPRGMNRHMPMRPQMPRGMNRPTPMGPQMQRGMNRPMSMRQQMPRGMNGPMSMRPPMERMPPQSRMPGPMRQMSKQGMLNGNNQRMMQNRHMNNIHQMPQRKMMLRGHPGMKRTPMPYRNRMRVRPHNVQLPLNRVQLMRARLTPDGRSMVLPCKIEQRKFHLISLRRPFPPGRFSPNQRLQPAMVQKLMAEKAKQFTGIPNTLPTKIVSKMNRVMNTARQFNPMINPAAINPVPSSNYPRPVVAPPVVMSKRLGVPQNQPQDQPQNQPEIPRRVQMMMGGYNLHERCRRILETGVSRCFKNAGIIAAPSDIFNPQNPSLAGKLCGLGGRVGPCIMAGETACGGGMRIVLTRRMLSQLLGAISNFCLSAGGNIGMSSSRGRIPPGPMFLNSPQETRGNAIPNSSKYPGGNMNPGSNMPGREMDFPRGQMPPGVSQFPPSQNNPQSDINDQEQPNMPLPEFPQPNIQEEPRNIITDGPNSEIPLPEDGPLQLPEEFPLEDELRNLVEDPQLECLNGGELVPEEGVAVCLCSVRFTGAHCEIPIEDMTSPEDPIPVLSQTDVIGQADPHFIDPSNEDIFDPSRPSRLDVNTETVDPPTDMINEVDPSLADPSLVDETTGDSFNPIVPPMDIVDEQVEPILADPTTENSLNAATNEKACTKSLTELNFDKVVPPMDIVDEQVNPQMNMQNDQGADPSLSDRIREDPFDPSRPSRLDVKAETADPSVADLTKEDPFDPSRPSRLDVKTETELANKKPDETLKTGSKIPMEPALSSADNTNKVVDKERLVSDAGASSVPASAKSKDNSKKETLEVAGFPLWMILAIALGFLFALFIVCLTLCVCVKCRRTKTVEITQLPEKVPLPDSMYTISAMPPTYESQGIHPLSYEEAKGETIYAVVKKEKKDEKEKEEKDNKEAKEEDSVEM